MNQWVTRLCHQSFLEKERVSRTKHPTRWRRSFFSHCVIVLRVIPKVRLSPRSEERS
jgi:hypothetical protein